MTTDRLARAITDTLDDLVAGTPTDYIDDVLARTVRTRQRPAWTFPGRYLAMSTPLAFAATALLATGAGIGAVAFLATPTTEPAPGVCVAPSPAASASDPDDVAVADCEPWIAYSWFRGEEAAGSLAIKAMRPDGSDAHVLASYSGYEEFRRPDWSHDGRRIAFEHDRGELADIWTMHVDGSRPEPLVRCDLPCRQLAAPSWSPDDARLAVARWDMVDTQVPGESCALEVIDVATEARTVILEGPLGTDRLECYSHPRWSPDGRSIVLTIDDIDAQDGSMIGSSVAVIDAEGPASQEPRPLTDPALLATHPDWHPTDDLIVFGQRDLDSFATDWSATNLYTIQADGTDLRQVTSYGDEEPRATWPTWTPDGDAISFTLALPSGTDLAEDWGDRRVAFIAPDGSGLRVIEVRYGVAPRVRPVP